MAWQEVITKRGRADKASPAAQTAADEILRAHYQIRDFKKMAKFTEAMHQMIKRENPRQHGARWEAKLATRSRERLPGHPGTHGNTRKLQPRTVTRRVRRRPTTARKKAKQHTLAAKQCLNSSDRPTCQSSCHRHGQSHGATSRHRARISRAYASDAAASTSTQRVRSRLGACSRRVHPARPDLAHTHRKSRQKLSNGNRRAAIAHWSRRRPTATPDACSHTSRDAAQERRI